MHSLRARAVCVQQTLVLADMQTALTNSFASTRPNGTGISPIRSNRLPSVTRIGRPTTVRRIAAEQEQKQNQERGGVGLQEPEEKNLSSNSPQDPKPRADTELDKAIGQLPPDQQQQLGKLYMFLTQHPEARVDVKNLGDVKRAMDNYQVLLWRPAELLNGRLAMIGFTAAVANEAITGASLWQQLYFAPYAYLSAYLLVVAASQLNKAFGSPSKGIGPFDRTAELINGRAAMVGYAILAYVEYNQELRKAAGLVYSRLQQQGGIGL